LTALKAYVVQRAGGHCQLCGGEAPFKDKNGDPYLEIHHAVPIRDGGSDSAENLIALCPNCHRKIHVSAEQNDMKKLQRIAASYSADD
jgi:5-methylcytosine-specific restriction endonuclease McrA